MELPLGNESQDLNSNPDARVWELSVERPLVARIKRVIETSCISLLIPKSSCLWAVLFGLSYSVSWNSWWNNCIYHGWGLKGCALTWSSLATAIQVNPYAQDFHKQKFASFVLKQTGIEWSASLSLNSLVRQKMVAAFRLQWSPALPLPELHPGITWEIASWPWTQPSQGLLWQFHCRGSWFPAPGNTIWFTNLDVVIRYHLEERMRPLAHVNWEIWQRSKEWQSDTELRYWPVSGSRFATFWIFSW